MEKVVTQALELPPALRAFVAEKLIESLDQPDAPPLSAKWKKEVLRRCAELDRGEVRLRGAGKCSPEPTPRWHEVAPVFAGCRSGTDRRCDVL